MMSAAQQEAGLRTSGMTISSEDTRSRLIDDVSGFAALGWVITEIAYELLLGPHVRLLRTIAVGSGVGALVGLLVSTLQWSAFRHYVKNAGRWIVFTTAGYTLAGLLGSFLLYFAIDQTEFFRSTLGVQGALSSGITGLVVAAMQWPVLKDWVGPGIQWRSWMIPVTLGTALAVPIAWLAGVIVLALLGWLIGDGAWPVVIAGSYLAAAIAGSQAYGRFLDRAFNRVLPGAAPTEEAT